MANSIPESPDALLSDNEQKTTQRTKTFTWIGLFIFAIVGSGCMFVRKDLLASSFNVAAIQSEPTQNRQLQEGATAPKVVWFMSYPESGTTYVLHLIHLVSGLSTATNYGTVMMDDNGKIYKPTSDSIPVYIDRVGPHYNSAVLPKPETYVLTRTHSYGTCFDCAPWKYLGPTSKLRHLKINTYASRLVGGIPKTNKYKMDDVEKMLVLYRDPMDLAMARFNHRLNKWKLIGDVQNVARYPNTAAGYKRYCRDQNDSEWHEQEKNWYEHGGFWEEAKNVPCRSEFVRIFEFYNMVERVRTFHGLATMRVKLNDFAVNLPQVSGDVVNFLSQPYLGPPAENKLGTGEGQFSSFYTDAERTAIAKLAKKMFTNEPAVWEFGFGPILEKYL
jgi:hypothetical protein